MTGPTYGRSSVLRPSKTASLATFTDTGLEWCRIEGRRPSTGNRVQSPARFLLGDRL